MLWQQTVCENNHVLEPEASLIRRFFLYCSFLLSQSVFDLNWLVSQQRNVLHTNLSARCCLAFGLFWLLLIPPAYMWQHKRNTSTDGWDTLNDVGLDFTPKLFDPEDAPHRFNLSLKKSERLAFFPTFFFFGVEWAHTHSNSQEWMFII